MRSSGSASDSPIPPTGSPPQAPPCLESEQNPTREEQAPGGHSLAQGCPCSHPCQAPGCPTQHHSALAGGAALQPLAGAAKGLSTWLMSARSSLELK